MLNIHVITFKKIFFLSYFIIHILAVAVLGNVRAFAPDELSYVECFKILYDRDFNRDPFGGWWNATTPFLRILYLPIKIFTFLPISDLVLLRFYSIVLTAIALFLLVHYTKVTHTHLGKIVLIVFTFTPSIFLWTTLAIKESFIFLTLVVFFLGIDRISKSIGSAGYFLCFFSGYSLLNLKGYLFIILTFAVFLAIIIKSTKSFKLEKSSLLLLIVLLVPYSLSPTTSALLVKGSAEFLTKTAELRAVERVAHTDSSQEDMDLGMTMNLLKNKKNQDRSLNAIFSTLQINEYLSLKASFYNNLPSKTLQAQRSLSPANPRNLKGFVVGLIRYLLFPNVLSINGSPILDLLGFEIFFWIFLYTVAIYIGWLSRSHLMKFHSILLITYSSGFLVVSEMTEINLGTAIRHRFILAILLIMFIGFQNSQMKKISNTKF